MIQIKWRSLFDSASALTTLINLSSKDDEERFFFPHIDLPPTELKW